MLFDHGKVWIIRIQRIYLFNSPTSPYVDLVNSTQWMWNSWRERGVELMVWRKIESDRAPNKYNWEHVRWEIRAFESCSAFVSWCGMDQHSTIHSLTVTCEKWNPRLWNSPPHTTWMYIICFLFPFSFLTSLLLTQPMKAYSSSSPFLSTPVVFHRRSFIRVASQPAISPHLS